MFDSEKIKINDITNFCNELKRIEYSLINCEHTIIIDDIVNKLNEFKNKSIKQKYYEGEEYLILSDIILERFKLKIDNHCILKMFLDLSRLHCDVQWLYKSKKIIPYLIPIIVENPFEYTDSNQVFIEDILYNFYYSKVIQNLENENYNTIISFFHKDIYLNSKKGLFVKKTVLKSIISNNKYLKKPLDIDILYSLL